MTGVNTKAKRYVWSVISQMGDDDEFIISDCLIDWGLFIEYCKAASDSRAIWPKDIHIYENKIRIVG